MGPDFGNLGFQAAIKNRLLGLLGNGPFLGQILAGSLLEPNFGNLAASGPQLKRLLGLLGNGPFWAKSWPGAFWSQVLAICWLLEASGKLWEARKRPETAVPLGQARGGQRTPRHKRFSRKIFPVGRVEPDAVFGHLGALFCVSEARRLFGSPGPFWHRACSGWFQNEGLPGEKARDVWEFSLRLQVFTLCIALRVPN